MIYNALKTEKNSVVIINGEATIIEILDYLLVNDNCLFIIYLFIIFIFIYYYLYKQLNVILSENAWQRLGVHQLPSLKLDKHAF